MTGGHEAAGSSPVTPTNLVKMKEYLWQSLVIDALFVLGFLALEFDLLIQLTRNFKYQFTQAKAFYIIIIDYKQWRLTWKNELN